MTKLLRIVLTCTLFVAWSASNLNAAERPNVLFLFSDDQRPDTIAAYGNKIIKTPNLDRLVRDGFSFRSAYCMGSIHGAVCQPSRAMLLSGRTLYRVPMQLQGVPLMPAEFAKAGYSTFGTGKWHNGAKSYLRAFQKGKAGFMGGMSDHTKVPVADIGPEHTLINKRKGAKFSTELFVDAAIDFLNHHDGEKPFFAYVAFSSPHDPRMPPGKFREMYSPQTMPLPANFKPQHPFNNGWMTGRDEALAPWPRTPKIIRSQLAEYYGMISHLDGQIGRLLAVLKQRGFAENTIIVFAADHGLALGSHGLLGKQNLYEHSMGTPVIVSGPGIPEGKQSSALVYLYDLFPTLCEISGVQVPKKVEGKSLLPIIKGTNPSVRASLFTTYEDIQRAVRDERWKLIRYTKINKTQLFDLLNDPSELKNLADDPAQFDRVTRMMKLLKTWQIKTDDNCPLTSNNPKSSVIDLTGRKRKPDRHQPKWIVDKYFKQK